MTLNRHKREDVAAVHSALSHHRLRNVKGLAQHDPEDAQEPRQAELPRQSDKSEIHIWIEADT
jgi:hypothetical protein